MTCVVKLITKLDFLPDVREFGEQGRGAGDQRPDQERPGKDTQELAEGLKEDKVGGLLDAEADVLLVVLEGTRHDHGNGVVQHGLAEDERVQVDVDVQVVEEGKDRDGVRGGDHGAEMQGVCPREYGGHLEGLFKC